MINKFDESKAFDYENGFYLTSPVYRMCNILAHCELYKCITELPGEVVELGVFKEASLIQFASFRELLENENSRKIIGFDMFGEFPQAVSKGDKKFGENWIGETGDEYLTKEEIQQALDLKRIGNTELVRGDIAKTVPKYVYSNPYLKIALLHIDVDLYEPSIIGLQYLYDKVVTGGYIVLDDYGVAGETDAVDEFFRNKNVEIKKLSISQRKPSYIVKHEI